jgi:hypothetical protein
MKTPYIFIAPFDRLRERPLVAEPVEATAYCSLLISHCSLFPLPSSLFPTHC